VATAVNVLIVGGGSIGERHLRCFQQVGSGDVALCEADPARRAELINRYGLKSAPADVDEAAGRDWDAVVICTPAHRHVEQAIRLAPTTPALLIEKPLSTRLDEIDSLRSATEGKCVQVAYVLRAHPAVQQAIGKLEEGAVGELLQVTVVAGQHFPTFRPAYREIYYTNHATGGGAVQDAVTHLVNLVQCFAGRFDCVFCDYAHQALEGVEVEDTVHLVGRAGGRRVMVSIALNQFMAPNETWVQLNGVDGSLGLRLDEHRWGLLCRGDDAWRWSEPLVAERDDLFRFQARAFLDAAAGRGPNLCPLDEAVHTLRVNLAALASRGAAPIAIEETAAEATGGAPR
jgi:predicted dehydrogenase